LGGDDFPQWVTLLCYVLLPGGALGLFSTLLWYFVAHVKKWLYFSVAIEQYSELEQWLNLWLTEKTEMRRIAHTAWLTLDSQIDPTKPRRRGDYYGYPPGGGSENQTGESPDGPPRLALLPMENSTYRLSFKGHILWVTRRQEGADHGNITRYLTLTTLCKNDKLIEDLVHEARELYNDKLKLQTVIWTVTTGRGMRGGGWSQLPARPSRPMKTVLLQGDVAQKVTNDVKEFLESADWYYRRGIPYRRGYLLYGPPGCGKTSFMTALAGELHMVICIINLSSPNLDDDQLLSLFSQAPKGSILLLEDVDAAFSQDSEQETEEQRTGDADDMTMMGYGVHARRGSKKGLTFSGLLNAIDGVAAQEGKVLFLTTNHIDKLDEALIRPGRIDMRVYVGLASQCTVKKLFIKFYEITEEERQKHQQQIGALDPEYPSTQELERLADSFSKKIPDKEYSMATIQGHLMDHRRSPQQALAQIQQLHITVESIRKQAKLAEEMSKKKKQKTEKAKQDRKNASPAASGPRDPPFSQAGPAHAMYIPPPYLRRAKSLEVSTNDI
jgi:hypothetical protein